MGGRGLDGTGRRRWVGALGGLVLVAGAWLAFVAPAAGDEPIDAVVQLDPEGTEPGGIDFGQTCSDVRQAIHDHLGGSATAPLPVTIPHLDLGPVAIGSQVEKARVTVNCGATNEIGFDGKVTLVGKVLDIDLTVSWDDAGDITPNVSVDLGLTDGDSTLFSVGEAMGIVTDLVPGLEHDPQALGDFALDGLSLHFAADDGDLEVDLSAISELVPAAPQHPSDPASDTVQIGYLLSVTDPAGDAPGQEAVLLNAARFLNADLTQETFSLAGVLQGPAGRLVGQIELPKMWMAMVQPAGASLSYADLRPVARSFFPAGTTELPTELRFDSKLSIGADVALDVLGDGLQEVFGWEDGAVAALHGKLGFDFGALTGTAADVVDLTSVDIDVDLPALAPGEGSPLPSWLALEDASLHVGWQEPEDELDGPAVEVSAKASMHVTVPDHTQPGGEISLPVDVEATIGSEDVGGVGQTSILFSAAPPPGSGTLWPNPYGLSWLNIDSVGVEVLVQLTDGEAPLVDGALTAGFDVGGKTFALRLSLSAVGEDLGVHLTLELKDTLPLTEVLELFGDFDLPPELDGLTIGGNPEDSENPKPPLRVTARLDVQAGDVSVAVAVNAPGTIPIAGTPFDVNLLFSIAFPAGDDPVLTVGARTGTPVQVRELLGGVLGPEMGAALQPGGALARFDLTLPPIGLVINTAPINKSSEALSIEEREFFRGLYGCGGDPEPADCDFDVKLGSGVHILSGVAMPTGADGRPLAADVLKALWVWDGPAGEGAPVPPPPNVLFRASVLLGDGESPSLSFDGVELALSLPVDPPESVRPDWFGSADLAIALGVDGSSAKLELAGSLTAQLRDETVPPSTATTNDACERSWLRVSRLPGAEQHACYDVLTFRILSQVSLSSSGASVMIGGDLLTEPGIGWPEPLGIPFLRVDAAKLRLGVTFAPAGPQFEIGLLAAGALFDKDFSGSILFGLKPLPNPPFVVPTFGGLRASSQAGLEVADVVDLYDAMRGFADGLATAAQDAGGEAGIDPALLALLDLPDLHVDLDSLPNMALRNLELMVGIGSSPDLCIEPGLKLAGELYLNATPLTVAPPAPPGGCNAGAPAVDPAECLAREAEPCFAAVNVNATLDGLVVSGALGELELGPLQWEDALLDLRFTPTEHRLQVKGGAAIEGLARGNVDLTIAADGVAFLGDVELFPDAVDASGEPIDVFRAMIEGQAEVDLKSFDFSDPANLLGLDVDLHAVLQADFEAAAREVLDPILVELRNNVVLLDAVVGQLLDAGDPLAVVLGLPDTLRQLGQPVPEWLTLVIDRLDVVTAEIEEHGFEVPDFDDLLTDSITLPGIEGQVIPPERTCYYTEPLTGATTPMEGTVIDGVCWSDPPDAGRLLWFPEGRRGAWVNPVCWAIEGLVEGEVVDGTCYRIAPTTLPSMCDLFVAPFLPEGAPCTYAGLRDHLVYPALGGALSGLGFPADTALPDLLDVLVDAVDGALPPVSFECVDFRLATAGLPADQGIDLRIDGEVFSQPIGLDVSWSFREKPALEAARLALQIGEHLFLEPADVECEPIGTTTVAGGAGGSEDAPLPAGFRPTLTTTGVEAGATTTLRSVVDPSIPASTPVLVAWGDGTSGEHTVEQLVAGIAHTYADDHPDTGTPVDQLAIEVTLLDQVEEVVVAVANVAPGDLSVTLPDDVDEGEAFDLSGSFTDPDTDQHVVRVDWGDGAPAEEISLAPGARTFSIPHTYADDDPSGTVEDLRRVKVTVVDDDTGTATVDDAVTVHNVDPSAVTVQPAGQVDEGGETSFAVSFDDPGLADAHLVNVDWGDGSRPQNLRLTPGERQLTVAHRYLDDNPTGTASDDVPVAVTVTDDDLGTGSTTKPVRVHNVAPQVSVELDPATIDEDGTTSATVRVVDPGALDTHEVRIAWGDPAFEDTVVQLPRGARQVTASRQYGDDGTFPVTATVTDDDTGTRSASAGLTVQNVDPQVAVDQAGTLAVAGGQTSFTREAETLALTAGVTDPGSDDITVTWAWGDGESTTTVHRADPAADDPLPSPSIGPRSLQDTASHAWSQACLYRTSATALDDDGGSHLDETWVVVTGTSTQRRGAGWWAQQHKDGKRNQNDLEAARVDCYLTIVRRVSSVFDEARPLATPEQARSVLDPSRSGRFDDPRQNLDRHLLTAWLNMSHGSIGWSELIDSDGDGTPDTPFLAFMQSVETARLAAATSDSQLLALKDAVERINER